MREIIARAVHGQRGSAVVLVALAMAVLMGMMALVADVGLAYVERAKISNAVDAAALAGAQELPDNPQAAEDYAYNYGEKNYIEQQNMGVSVDPAEGSIVVSATRMLDRFFSIIFSDAEMQTGWTSEARVGNITAVRGGAPLAVQKEDFVMNEPYLLKAGAGDDEDEDSHFHTGFYGALALGGGGSSRYEENLTEGYEGVLSVGDVIPTETGNMSNPTRRAIDDRIARSDDDSYEDVSTGSPRVLIVPVYEGDGEERPDEIEIVAFAAFYVEEVLGQGIDSKIHGYFIEYTAAGEIGETEDFGLFGVKLVR